MKKNTIRIGMVGLGMIFRETYLPVFQQGRGRIKLTQEDNPYEIQLIGVASQTERSHSTIREQFGIPCYAGPDAVNQLLSLGIDALCIATPDGTHHFPALQGLRHGCHVLIEKPSVLSLQDLDVLEEQSNCSQSMARVVYHKLADPDHKRLRTLVGENVLCHVNSGYCTLLEPKSISQGTFAAWVSGRNPSTYVAVHYFKLIDFTFGPATLAIGWKLKRIGCHGQRGIVGPSQGSTWDSVQNHITYEHPDGREATFDIHTSWVNPDNFPGYVDQEVQFRFDNGTWNASQRKRGVELVVDGLTPIELKTNINNHYNACLMDPWGPKVTKGYGLEVLERFFAEIAHVEWDGSKGDRNTRLNQVKSLSYADLSGDRNVVAMVHATEAILDLASQGKPGGVVEVNGEHGGLVLSLPGVEERVILYEKPI